MDANAKQIGLPSLCHGRDDLKRRPDRRTPSQCGDEVGARSRYIGSRCPADGRRCGAVFGRQRSRTTCRSRSTAVRYLDSLAYSDLETSARKAYGKCCSFGLGLGEASAVGQMMIGRRRRQRARSTTAVVAYDDD